MMFNPTMNQTPLTGISCSVCERFTLRKPALPHLARRWLSQR
jgi:predicted transcriptional regulator